MSTAGAGLAERIARPIAEWGDRTWLAPLLALVLLASLLRAPTLADRSLWLDEINVAAPGLSGYWPAIERARFHADATPLDYVLIATSERFFGSGEVPARLPAAIFGVAAVVAIYFLGRAIGGGYVGLVAGLLLAASPSHVWYSQEARFYSLLAFFTVATTLTFVAAIRHRRWWLWGAYAGTVALGLYAGYQTVLVIAIHICMLVVGTGLRRWRAPASLWIGTGLALGTAALLFLPWYLWDDTSTAYAYGSTPTRAVADNLAWILTFNSPVIFSHFPVDPAWAVTAFLMAAAAVTALIAGKRNDPIPLAAAGAVAALPFVVLAIIRYQNYFFSARHLMFLVPVIYLVVAYGAVQLMRGRAALAVCGALLLAGFLVLSGLGLAHQRTIKNKGEELREAAQYLQTHMSEDDRLAAFHYDLLLYYHDFGEVSAPYTPDELARFVKETPGDAWVFTTHRQWRAPFWKDLAPVLTGGQFEEVEFAGVLIFVAPGGTELQLQPD